MSMLVVDQNTSNDYSFVVKKYFLIFRLMEEAVFDLYDIT